MKRIPKGSSKGGQFAPDPKAPSTSTNMSSKNIETNNVSSKVVSQEKNNIHDMYKKTQELLKNKDANDSEIMKKHVQEEYSKRYPNVEKKIEEQKHALRNKEVQLTEARRSAEFNKKTNNEELASHAERKINFIKENRIPEYSWNVETKNGNPQIALAIHSEEANKSITFFLSKKDGYSDEDIALEFIEKHGAHWATANEENLARVERLRNN